MDDSSIHRAVEIAKAAIPSQNGVWIGSPDVVAKFIETVAKKLEELSTTRRP
jgi:hypothetical protein